jgi:hypothetical protein
MTKVWIGPQGEAVEIREKPDSSVAAGTDRSELEYAAEQPLVGPQGEIIAPLDAVCPTCGQAMPETSTDCSKEN